MQRIACAPGKIILSGEHSVVYGEPALATAVNRHMRIYYQPDRLPRLSWSALERTHVLGLDKFSALRHRLDNHFERYLRGELKISDILKKPAELAFYAIDVAHLLSDLDEIPRGALRVESDIPIGAGMGSSAALIAAVLKLFSPIQDTDKLIHEVRHIERLQHGKGSLIDAAAICTGGLVRLHSDKVESVELTNGGLGKGWYWVFTGTPACSTGVCVDQVRRNFGTSAIWSEFGEVTRRFEAQLAAGESIVEPMRENHRLLARIGVVPAPLTQLAGQVEAAGGAAKVAGAGAVTGDNGGLMILWLPEGSPDQFSLPPDWHWGPLKEETRGVHIIED